MNIYVETVQGSFKYKGAVIPADEGNRDFQRMQAEVATGDATIIPYDDSDEELEDLKESAYAENSAYAAGVVRTAESNPTGTPLSERGTEKQNLRRDNRSKGKNKLTDDDDHLSDFLDTVADVLDNADDAVEDAEKAALEVWDSSSFGWPEWAPLP
jgi:hypothetical protein